MSPALATTIMIEDQSDYAVLTIGKSRKSASLSEWAANGSRPVGGTGKMILGGSNSIPRKADPAAAANPSFATERANLLPASESVSQRNLATDLTSVNALSTTLGGLAGIAINPATGSQSMLMDISRNLGNR